MADRPGIKKRGDGRWTTTWRDDRHREHVKTFSTKRDAEDHLDRTRVDLASGTYIDPRGGRITFKKWSERWLEVVRPSLKPSTAASYESLLRRINERFGTTNLNAIRPSDIQEWLGQLTAEGLSASRVRKVAIVMKMACDLAVRDNLIRQNPAFGVKPPRIERHEAAYFEPAIVERIAAAMPTDEYALLIRVLGVGGLRFGEAAALNREHIDLARRRLHVRESLTEVGGELVRTSTKTYQHRQVPLSPTVAKALSHHLDVEVGPEPDAPVFHAPRGGELRYGAFHARVWKPTLEKLKLPHAGLHVCRHSAAARMIQAGASPKVVQSVLGHRSAAFTLTVYGHLFESDLDDLASRLDFSADFTRTLSAMNDD